MVFKTKSLEYYVTNAISRHQAAVTLIKNKIGVTSNDMVMWLDIIPDDAIVFDSHEIYETEIYKDAIQADWDQHDLEKKDALNILNTIDPNHNDDGSDPEERMFTFDEVETIVWECAKYFKAMGGNEKDNCWFSYHNEYCGEWLDEHVKNK